MELPLLRILQVLMCIVCHAECTQSNSEDLESVSDYYSGELVAYVRKVSLLTHIVLIV